MLDVFLVFAAFVMLVTVFSIAQLWWWVGLWITIGIILAIFEAVSYKKTGTTLSQQVWAEANETKKAIIACVMIILWIGLMCHLFL